MNYYYRNSIQNFLNSSIDEAIGVMTRSNEFDATFLQNKSWELQIPILKRALKEFNGEVFFEFSIPRMGKRVDTLVIILHFMFLPTQKTSQEKPKELFLC